MFDQHMAMCKEKGITFDFSKYPALQAQHAALKARRPSLPPSASWPALRKAESGWRRAAPWSALQAEPALAAYFASDFYTKYAFNNPMPPAHFVGSGFGSGPFGPTTETLVATF